MLENIKNARILLHDLEIEMGVTPGELEHSYNLQISVTNFLKKLLDDVNRELDEEYDNGYDIGYDKGFEDGREEALEETREEKLG